MNAAKAGAPDSRSSAELETRLAALQRALSAETRRADVLNQIAASLRAAGDLESVVRAVMAGGVELSGAEFGTFWNPAAGAGRHQLYGGLAGAPRSALTRLPPPSFSGGGVVRSDDITLDPRYGASRRRAGSPGGPPVRSYLAAPVLAGTGEVIGGLCFGHSRPGMFPQRLEQLVTGLAAQAAAGIEDILRRGSVLDVAGESRAHERLHFALEAGRLGSWELDIESRAYQASEICKANYGRRPEEPFSFEDLVASVHPADRDRMVAAIERTIRTFAEYDVEYRVIDPSGKVRWVHVRGRAARTAELGGVRRMAGISLDVTERKRAEERQKLLLNELNHRVKNTLATVQSIASNTLRRAADPGAFREAFEARILALSQTHNLLTSRNWEDASLREILGLELRPHAGGREGGGSRFVLESDRDVRLSAKAAVALGMAIHELATNAVKHGALSRPAGRVTVRTSTSGSGEDEHLLLEWTESGGPPVAEPQRRGFGSRVIETGLAAELGGEVRLDYRPQGLSCRMRLLMRALEP